ncbi:RPL18 [Ecytonucleospora hepatopenaei]|uniref:RPL18 n=1 Tax=Ecytonucleospora hepatopenaei TaxID=646526 RepID=A0A1W0E4K5_9MICR|nr:RPL18 [Ecytonucleospora hepatopenaei]
MLKVKQAQHQSQLDFFTKIIDAHPIMKRVVRRLATTNRVRQPVKVSKVIDVCKSGKIPVIVAKLLDDERILELPANMQIVAFKCSHTVKRKVESAGGKIFTLDQMIKVSNGDLSKLQFVQTDPSQRKSSKYWGLAPGEKGSTAYPRANNKCKNKEKRVNVPKKVKYDFDNEFSNE